jgi:hypothetical protein
MILDRDHAVSLLAEALPQLREELHRIREEWLPDQPPFTVLMGALGHALSASVGSLGDDAVQHIADILETLLRTGTEDVKDGLATGLFESLLASSETQPGTIRLLKRLGPESAKYCREWDKFTGVKTPGL